MVDKKDDYRWYFWGLFASTALLVALFVLMFYFVRAEIAKIVTSQPTVVIEPQSRYWNESLIERVERECSLLCSGFDSYIPVAHEEGCVCCNEDLAIDPYVKCVYYSLEEEAGIGV